MKGLLSDLLLRAEIPVRTKYGDFSARACARPAGLTEWLRTGLDTATARGPFLRRPWAKMATDKAMYTEAKTIPANVITQVENASPGGE